MTIEEKYNRLLDLVREMRRAQRKFYQSKKQGVHMSPAESIRWEREADRFLAEEDGAAQGRLDFD